MSDLVINGIDHSVFDLEWAKRGGLVLVEKEEGHEPDLMKYINTPNDIEQLRFITIDGDTELFSLDDVHLIRMATQEECTKLGGHVYGGAEYIKHPVMENPIYVLDIGCMYNPIDTVKAFCGLPSHNQLNKKIKDYANFNITNDEYTALIKNKKIAKAGFTIFLEETDFEAGEAEKPRDAILKGV